MKKIVAVILVFVMCLSLAACGGTASSGSAASSALPETSSSTSQGDLDAVGDISVSENLFDVEITVPAGFVGEATQEELNQQAQENDIHSITLNEDGSATYVMSKSQHAAMLEDLAASINDSLTEMVGSEEFPAITAVKANDNFTSFTVSLSSETVGLSEGMSVIGLYMYGGLYGVFSGDEPENVHVDFVNANTGEVIETADSTDMAE